MLATRCRYIMSGFEMCLRRLSESACTGVWRRRLGLELVYICSYSAQHYELKAYSDCAISFISVTFCYLLLPFRATGTFFFHGRRFISRYFNSTAMY